MHEKESYKLLAKAKEYKYIIHEQKKQIQETDKKMAHMKQLHLLEI